MAQQLLYVAELPLEVPAAATVDGHGRAIGGSARCIGLRLLLLLLCPRLWARSPGRTGLGADGLLALLVDWRLQASNTVVQGDFCATITTATAPMVHSGDEGPHGGVTGC